MSEQDIERTTIDRHSVVSQVYEYVRLAILRGQFKPGERLVETQLAGSLGVSRTPIREVLSKLEVEGLVTRLPTGGVVVEDVESELAEIYGLRRLLEGFAARLAAERASSDELDEIELACERGYRAISEGTVGERREVDRAFHELIAKATHSPRVLRLANDYYEYALSDDTLPLYDQDLSRKLQDQHHAIAAALRNRQPDAAEQLASAHVEDVLNIAFRALDTKKRDEKSSDGLASSKTTKSG